ncbi:MAG: VWA domain-containing protein [bacterium]|nr:VWA domain-containing protein [bacterium]
MTRFPLLLVLAIACAHVALAQFVLPRPEPTPDLPRHTWQVESRYVDMQVTHQVATVTVTETLLNTCGRAFEADYLFPLPPDAAVSSLTLTVDGREMSGEIMDADAARRYYEDIVRRRKDPALLEYAGLGCFRLSAFPLEPGKPARISLRYDQILRRESDLTELTFPLATARRSSAEVAEIEVVAEIHGTRDITTVYSPTVDIEVDYPTSQDAVVRYSTRNEFPSADFVVYYREDTSEVGATLLSYFPERGKDGYYLLLVSPHPCATSQAPLAKDVILVLDRSGSMSGEKIAQARDAARFVINNLNPEDRFELISYNDGVETCFNALLPGTNENRARALEDVNRVESGGGTNIHDALGRAMEILSNGNRQASLISDATRPAYVFFMTDGLPTVGVTDEQLIIADTRRANDTGARLFCFGVGYDVNVRLLDNLSNTQGGRSSYVKPEEDIEANVSALYAKIKNPVMSDLAMSLDGFKLRDGQPSQLGDLFKGDQIVQVGRLASNRPSNVSDDRIAANLLVSGIFENRPQDFNYPVSIEVGNRRSSFKFIEKLWAQRRVAFLLDEVRLKGKTGELIDEIVELATRYGIVTPYTSYLADENSRLSSVSELRIETSRRADALFEDVQGKDAQVESQSIQSMRSLIAPKASVAQDGSLRVRGGREMEADETQSVSTMRQIGGEIFYKRGDYWIESSLTHLDLEKDLDQCIHISRFSDAYFNLIAAQSAAENALLSGQRDGEKFSCRSVVEPT